MEQYTFYTDPGHGWLEVPREDIIKLNLENEISHFSFVEGDKCYLEEDCDAPLFFETFSKLHGRRAMISIHNSDQRSQIRDLDNYYV